MLNIIPKEQKKELRLEKIYFKVRKISIFVTTAVVLLALLLVGNYYILENSVARTQEDILLSSINLSGIENLKQDIISFNAELAKAKQIQNSHINPLLMLEKFSGIIPTNISLTYLSFNLAEETINIQGVAKDRDALLSLQNNLNSSEVFIDFEYPLGSLTEKENIDFLFEGTIVLDKI